MEHPTPEGPRSGRAFEVVLNRESGALRELWHDGLAEEFRQIFAEHGVAARVCPVAPAELGDAFEAAVTAAPDAVVVGGGDGTVSAAAERLAGSDLPLGVLPLGTFNMSARNFGVPLDAKKAIAALAAAPIVSTDVLDVAGRACLCALMIGFYPALARERGDFHGRAWWRKSLRILCQTLSTWSDSPRIDLKTETREGNERSRRTRFAAFVPGDFDDVFSIMPKRRNLASGKMTIYLSRHRSLPALMRGALAYLTGRLKHERDVERIRTVGVVLRAKRRREVEGMIDGEISRLPLPLELRIRPTALRVLYCGKENG